MTHSFLNGVLTLTDTNGNIASYPHHPEQLRPWASEQEALDYVAGRQIYFSPPPTVDAQRPQKLTQINAEFDAAMNQLVAGYPEREISSWSQQEKEATAYQAYLDSVAAGSTTAVAPNTPLLDALATARGFTVDALTATILKKSSAFASASGALIGKRQALEDAVNAATTLTELEAITW